LGARKAIFYFFCCFAGEFGLYPSSFNLITIMQPTRRRDVSGGGSTVPFGAAGDCPQRFCKFHYRE